MGERFLRLRELFFAALFVILPSLAAAHPHVWVDSASEMIYDAKGRLTAIRHHWLFDEEFSAYALQGLDTNRDGKYSAAELKPLAKENVELLKDFDYFTFLSVGDYQAGFGAPTNYYLELLNGRLMLHFTLPLAMPLLTDGTTHLEVYDPDYYVAFTLPNENAVRLVNAPAACKIAVHPGKKPDAAAAAALAAIGADVRALPPGMKSLTDGIANSADVNCGGAAPAPANVGAAISAVAGGGSGDLTALPRASTTVSAESTATESGAGAPAQQSAAAEAAAVASLGGGQSAAQSTPPATPPATAPTVVASAGPALEALPLPQGPSIFRVFMARIVALQTAFNRELTAGLKGLKSGGGFWWLGGVCFLYGIVHAAGPGHGKVVISTYLVANEARVRRGVVIAFIAAFVQAVVAVGIIGLMAVILNMTSMAITATAKTFEAGSFALVAGLGLYLLAQKGRAAWAVVKGGDPHAHHHHHHHDHGAGDHHHDHAHAHGHDADAACAHSHLPSEAALAKPGLPGAAAAVISVGMRPCSGALIVLVFALSQGIFWAGVASTFVMALGTAMTVAALAALAVGAKDVARWLARGSDRRGSQVMLGLELAAAVLITVVGAVLFVATIYGGAAPNI